MLAEEVRAHCAEVARTAQHVSIDLSAASYDGGVVGLDPALHPLDAAPGDVARHVLMLDAINFGSGWFEELGTDTNTLTAALTAAAWTADDLRALDVAAVGAALGLDPAHRLTHLYTQALTDQGAWLRDRGGDQGAWLRDRSAQAFAASLLEMPLYADPGFYKRAQITANDLVLAGVAAFDDVDRLTVFADNLLPHVLRVDGVLTYTPALAARIDAGEPLEHGSREEIELRACAVHACEGLAAAAGVPPRTLDNWLWNRGLEYPGRPHRTLTAAY